NAKLSAPSGNGQAADGGMGLYEYNKTLPLGFVIDSGTMSSWNLEAGNPFTVQNDFVKFAVGSEDKIFHQLKTKQGNPGNFTVDYSLEQDDTFKDSGDGPLDVYFFCTTDAENLTATVSGKTEKTCSFSATNQNYICHIGDVERGSSVSITGGDNKNVSTCYAYAFDQDAWQQAFDLLNSQPLKVTEWKDTKITGTVDVENAGLLYTSIPYEEGWSIYLDGNEVEPGKICKDSLIGISVTPGKHTVEFKYTPKGFVPGLLITLFSIVLLVFLVKRERLLIWFDNNKRKKSLNK
ncbi:MAG: YfhO family protein, partial [Eubacterium sp.]|nr:YfhO family protein [Eubacterium sp.]